MPSYDFRCNACGQTLTLFYKSFRAYDEATPRCPHCDSIDLTRQITQVAVHTGPTTHNFADMSANQMLSVFESGDAKAVGEMMKQVGDSAPKGSLGNDYHTATDMLQSGASKDKVERELRQSKPAKPPKSPKSGAD